MMDDLHKNVHADRNVRMAGGTKYEDHNLRRRRRGAPVPPRRRPPAPASTARPLSVSCSRGMVQHQRRSVHLRERPLTRTLRGRCTSSACSAWLDPAQCAQHHAYLFCGVMTGPAASCAGVFKACCTWLHGYTAAFRFWGSRHACWRRWEVRSKGQDSAQGVCGVDAAALPDLVQRRSAE